MSQQSISFPVRCSHCQAEMSSPIVCEACHTLQPISGEADPFELLQLAPTYRVDLDELEDVYLRLSRMIHPDYFAQTGGPEKRLSEDLSARLNNAYRLLKDPLRRSEYLVSRAGGPSASDDKHVPPAMLAEVMTLRERIEEAKAAGRSDELSAVNAELSARAGRSFERLARLHDELESAQAGGDEKHAGELLGEIRTTLNGIRFMQNLVRESGTQDIIRPAPGKRRTSWSA